MGIKRKIGDCGECKEEGVYLGRVNPPQCLRCYKLLKAKEYQRRAKERELVKPVKKNWISPISSKMAKNLKEYRKVRDRYLKNNPICEVRGCNNQTTNLHHKAGREGKLLANEEYFMACCGGCHPAKIHNNPNWAEKEGYIIRLRGINK